MDTLTTTATALATGTLLAAAALIAITKARTAHKKRQTQKARAAAVADLAASFENIVQEINSHVLPRARFRQLMADQFPLLREGRTQP